MESVQGVMFTILLVVIQFLVVIAGLYLIGFLKKMNIKTRLNLNDAALNQIKEIIDDIVVSTNQKIVSALKEKNPNGKLTDEEAEKVFNSVKDTVLECLSGAQIDYIIDTYSDVDEGLSILIEKAVSYNHETVIPTEVVEEA